MTHGPLIVVFRQPAIADFANWNEYIYRSLGADWWAEKLF
jgi:hypothetical protein